MNNSNKPATLEQMFPDPKVRAELLKAVQNREVNHEKNWASLKEVKAEEPLLFMDPADFGERHAAEIQFCRPSRVPANELWLPRRLQAQVGAEFSDLFLRGQLGEAFTRIDNELWFFVYEQIFFLIPENRQFLLISELMSARTGFYFITEFIAQVLEKNSPSPQK